MKRQRDTLFVVSTFFLASTTFLLRLALASGDRGAPVNTEYECPSKHFVLRIHPGHPEGYGAAEYSMLKDNKEVWRETFPFTLFDVCVLDDGTSAGYGYTLGLDGTGGEYREHRRNYGELVVVIVDPQGRIRVKEAYQRDYGEHVISIQLPEPQADAIVADPKNDRLVFLVTYNRHRLGKPANAAWRQFQLSTGRPLGVFYPEEQMTSTKWLGRCIKAQALPGTSLFLAQWYHAQWNDPLENPPVAGCHFALLDSKCNPVWQRTLRDDYDSTADENREKRLLDWIDEHSAILSVDAPGQFDLYFAKDGQRVSFAAKQDENGKWTVVETGRKGYTPPGLAVSPCNTPSEGKSNRAPSENREEE